MGDDGRLTDEPFWGSFWASVEVPAEVDRTSIFGRSFLPILAGTRVLFLRREWGCAALTVALLLVLRQILPDPEDPGALVTSVALRLGLAAGVVVSRSCLPRVGEGRAVRSRRRWAVRPRTCRRTDAPVRERAAALAE